MWARGVSWRIVRLVLAVTVGVALLRTPRGAIAHPLASSYVPCRCPHCLGRRMPMNPRQELPSLGLAPVLVVLRLRWTHGATVAYCLSSAAFAMCLLGRLPLTALSGGIADGLCGGCVLKLLGWIGGRRFNQ